MKANRGKHTSLNKELKNAVIWLERQTYVTKIVLGPYHNCRHHYTLGLLKYQRDIDAGIKVNGYDGDGIRDIFVYIDPIEKREEVKKSLESRFD